MIRKIFCSLCGIIIVKFSPASANDTGLYSIKTGSIVYHMTGNHGQYNENFNNAFFLLSVNCNRIQSTVF